MRTHLLWIVKKNSRTKIFIFASKTGLAGNKSIQGLQINAWSFAKMHRSLIQNLNLLFEAEPECYLYLVRVLYLKNPTYFKTFRLRIITRTFRY